VRKVFGLAISRRIRNISVCPTTATEKEIKLCMDLDTGLIGGACVGLGNLPDDLNPTNPMDDEVGKEGLVGLGLSQLAFLPAGEGIMMQVSDLHGGVVAETLI
jgi:hypothetical protein